MGRTIKPLTSLRFIFAFMVFLSHLDWIPETEVVFNKWYRHIFSKGYLGVSFFFILSGFILSLNYKKRFLKKKISLGQFWIARIARIYPLHVFTLILSLPVFFSESFTAPIAWAGRFLSNLFLVQSFVPIEEVYFGFNAVSWSISNELFYYVMFPFLLLLLYKKRQLLFIFILLVVTLLLVMLMAPETQHIYLFAINPLFRITDFILGILLYSLYEKGIFSRLFTNKKSATFIETGGFILLAGFLIFHSYIPFGLRLSMYYWIPMMIIILSFAYQAGKISLWLSHRHFILLGEISFSFYMLHGLIMRYIKALDRRIKWIENDYIIIGIVFVLIIIASYYSYKYLELPMNQYIRNKFSPKRKSQKAVEVEELFNEEIIIK